jgi:hypothetical protein
MDPSPLASKPLMPKAMAIVICAWILFVNIWFFTGRAKQSAALQKIRAEIGNVKR